MSSVKMETNIGTFIVDSGKMIISDPCYEKDSGGGFEFDVFEGKWDAYVTNNYEGRVETLVVVNKDYDTYTHLFEGNFVLITDKLPVDSGQMAVCDYDEYTTNGENDEYDKYCLRTSNNENRAGIVGRYAVVSGTGWGDGSYDLYGAKIGDRYYAFLIEFIPDEEEYDEEEDEWDWCEEE